MAEERIEETAYGYYVRSGDILEWKWKKEPDKPEAEPEPLSRPATADAKSDWEEYAAELGIDSEGLTKAELIEAVRETEEAEAGEEG